MRRQPEQGRDLARFQVVLEHDSSLSFNLLDMSEGRRKAGAAVQVNVDGQVPVSLPCFSGSTLSSLNP